ncbi:MAG: hypothetical protein NPIRA05_11910 [Nitrospirales bacterium]|nr:MAG: hypothetical protein NPIRA05_11910 [Nitrospirales bacterium]
MYANGAGVPRDYATARKWYLKAAAQGYAKAQSRLGNMYYQGQGVPQDYAAAREWWRKAATQGDSDAESWLASMDIDLRSAKENQRSDFKERDYQDLSGWEMFFGALILLGEAMPEQSPSYKGRETPRMNLGEELLWLE